MHFRYIFTTKTVLRRYIHDTRKSLQDKIGFTRDNKSHDLQSKNRLICLNNSQSKNRLTCPNYKQSKNKPTCLLTTTA